MIGPRRVRRTGLILTLAAVLLTCGKDSTAPEPPTLHLLVSAPREDIRAVLVEINASLTPRAAPGYSILTHPDTTATRLIIVAAAGNSLPIGEELVATLEDAGPERSSYTAKVTQAASADYEPQAVTGYSARIEAR